MRSRESYTPTKSRGTTPFSSRSTRSPSPAVDKKRTFSITNPEHCEVHSPFRGRSGTGTKMTLRKRSPSPVVTGKVSSFRSKFEPVASVTPPSAQTIPRTYRLKAREPQDIFCHSQSSTPPLNSPGNYRFQKLSRDSSGMMSKAGSNTSSLSRNPSTSRLPNHFISLEPPLAGSEVNKPKINRAQSLRTPRYFSPSDNATQNAATYLRSMLPKKMSEDSKMRGPFGYNRS